MAQSNCAKCGNTQLEIVEASPRGWTHKVAYLQCASCGAVAGVMPVFDAGVTTLRLQADLQAVALKLDEVERKVSGISARVR